MTTEPPKGLRANLLRLYNTLTEEGYAQCKAAAKYQKLVFALSYFHRYALYFHAVFACSTQPPHGVCVILLALACMCEDVQQVLLRRVGGFLQCCCSAFRSAAISFWLRHVKPAFMDAVCCLSATGPTALIGCNGWTECITCSFISLRLQCAAGAPHGPFLAIVLH
eukprot:scaffold95835_cov20-Tisochrysis_lutea.AAC.1